MRRLYIILLLKTITILNSLSQSSSSMQESIFYGEIKYDTYTTVDVTSNDNRTYNFFKQLENVREQVYSFEDDIWITAISGKDTSWVAICNSIDTYTIFYPEKKKMRFGASKSNNLDNYTLTEEHKSIMGFNCYKYVYQVNDNIYTEKWITQDFGYEYLSKNIGQCHSIFTNQGLVIASKSTTVNNDYIIVNESKLSSYLYDSLYVRSNQINSENEIGDSIVDFKIPSESIEINLIDHKDRIVIQLDSIIDMNNNYINGETIFGNYTIINFWTSWCKPCLMNMPRLSELKEIYNSEGLNILSISIDQNLSHEQWLIDIEENKMNWNNVRTVMEEGSKMWKNIQIQYLPKYLLVDKNGYILLDDIEAIKSNKFELWLNDLISSNN